VAGEEQRDAEFDDDPLYEDLDEDDLVEEDPDGRVAGGSDFWSIAHALMPPGCLTAVITLVGCVVVALSLVK
jgi:hypothetical protein